MVNRFVQGLRLALLATTLLLTLSGCTAAGLVGGECARGLVACEGMCVNPGTDSEHCGSCGQACRSGFECRVGVCLPESNSSERDAQTDPGDAGRTIEAGPGPSYDAEPPAPDHDSGRPPPVGPVPDSGPDEPCFAPYNSAEHCGACNLACGVEAPFCAPVDDSFECVDGCPESLQLCADRCVDVTSDPLHCGSCGSACPTGLCQDRACVGGSAGHVVAMCMSFEQLFSNSPQSVLLANAVFLATAPMTRVLMFERYATSAARNGMRSVVLNASDARGRPVSFDVAGSATEIVSQLQISDYDVFLMADTSQAPSGALGELGRNISTTLDSFVAAGGVVVVAHGAEATEMVDFWGSDGAGLFEIEALHDITFTELQNRSPGDSLAANVLTPFLALSTTCAYEMVMESRSDQNTVITGVPATDAGGELPVVIHRVTLQP